MPTELDTPAILAGLIFWTVLIGSTLLWINHNRLKNAHAGHQSNVSAWPIGWVNFGILICAMIISVFVVQGFSSQIIYTIAPEDLSETPDEPTEIDRTGKDSTSAENNPADEGPELTPWIAVWAVLALQLPMLATFYGLRRLYPNHYTGKLNQQPLAIGKAMSLTFLDFIRYLPVIWIANLAWLGLVGTSQPYALLVCAIYAFAVFRWV